jgi:hypothetical protein
MAVSFIGGGDRSNQSKPPTCRKLLINDMMGGITTNHMLNINIYCVFTVKSEKSHTEDCTNLPLFGYWSFRAGIGMLIVIFYVFYVLFVCICICLTHMGVLLCK